MVVDIDDDLPSLALYAQRHFCDPFFIMPLIHDLAPWLPSGVLDLIPVTAGKSNHLKP